MPPGHSCSPQSPSPGHLPRPAGPACCPRWPGRAGSRSASCCPCPSPPALPGQPEPASPGRREGPPRALPGLDPLSPAPPEWEQPGCRAPHTTVTLRACSSPSRAQSRGRPPSPGAHSHTPPLTSHPFPQAVRACLLSQEHVAPGEEPAGCGAQRTGTEAPHCPPRSGRRAEVFTGASMRGDPGTGGLLTRVDSPRGPRLHTPVWGAAPYHQEDTPLFCVAQGAGT